MKILISLLVTSLFLCSPALSNSLSCKKLIPSKNGSLKLPVIRFGYLPMQSRLIGGRGSEDSLWTVSRLGLLKSGDWAWERSVSTLNAVKNFEFPMPKEVLEKAEEQENTQKMSRPLLDFVYQRFTDELVKREVFTKDFINDLRAEDRARLEQNFTIWSAVKDGEIVATWGLYKHTEGDFSGQFEIIRTAARNRKTFTLEHMLPLISEYFNSTKIDSGLIVVRTDRVGARKFKQLGASEVSSYDSGKKFILEMPIEAFLQKFQAPEIQYGNQPLQLFRFLDENFIM